MAKQVLTSLDFNSVAKIINLPNPSAAQDAATKSYVDSAVEGISWKASARVASTANVNLSAPGSSIDGITMASSDRALLKNQTTASENGIWIWNGAAVAMTRAADANSAKELEQACVSIEEGSSAGTTYRQSSVNFTIDSGAVSWTSFGVATPAASETTSGIAEIATQAETDSGTDDLRIVTPLKLANSANKKLKYLTTIGDGSATQFTVTHNLNSKDVFAQIYRNSTPWDSVECDVERTTVNSLTLRFAAAPSASQFAVVVLG